MDIVNILSVIQGKLTEIAEEHVNLELIAKILNKLNLGITKQQLEEMYDTVQEQIVEKPGVFIQHGKTSNSYEDVNNDYKNSDSDDDDE